MPLPLLGGGEPTSILIHGEQGRALLAQVVLDECLGMCYVTGGVEPARRLV